MAESTASIEYTALLRIIGRQVGYLAEGETHSDLSAEQTSEIDDIINIGYMQFLFPPILAGEPEAHRWSFLAPVATLTTAADDIDYDLPDDFGGMRSPYLTISSTTGYPPVAIRGEGQIRALHSRSTTSGIPKVAAVRAKSSDASDGQRFEVLIWPTPDAAYDLDYPYNRLVNKLTVANPYPLGGMAHSPAILASCQAAAENAMDDQEGVHWKRFIERRLPASISQDRSVGVPQNLGYNGDSSDEERIRIPRIQHVTYEGVLYD